MIGALLKGAGKAFRVAKRPTAKAARRTPNATKRMRRVDRAYHRGGKVQGRKAAAAGSVLTGAGVAAGATASRKFKASAGERDSGRSGLPSSGIHDALGKTLKDRNAKKSENVKKWKARQKKGRKGLPSTAGHDALGKTLRDKNG
jgi:hypothetical protein